MTKSPGRLTTRYSLLTALEFIYARIYNVYTSTGGMTVEAVIRKWGNSPALRLPKSVLKEAGYRLEQTVEIVVSRGRIIIQPCQKVEYDLDSLVGGITTGNAHGEVSFGEPQGKESL